MFWYIRHALVKVHNAYNTSVNVFYLLFVLCAGVFYGKDSARLPNREELANFGGPCTRP